MAHSAKISEVLLDCFRVNYELVDTRRRRSFYILLSMSLFFLAVRFTQPEPMKLPFLSVEVTTEDALVVGPFFIIAALTSYLYLCSHTLKSYMTYLCYFVDNTDDEGINFGWLYGNVKRKDITEGFNIFHMPILPVPGYDHNVDRHVSIVGHLPINLLALLANIFPYFVSIACATWVITNNDKYENSFFEGFIGDGSILAIFVYLSLFVFSMIAVFYFKKRCKSARGQFLNRCLLSDYAAIKEYYGMKWSFIIAWLLGVPRK